MAVRVHISSGTSSAAPLDLERVIDADDLSVGDVFRAGGEVWAVTDVRRAYGVTELTIEPANGDGWPGPIDEPRPLFTR
jgi:hypothetical protein